MKRNMLSFIIVMLFLLILTACNTKSNSDDSRYYDDVYSYLSGTNLIEDNPLSERIDYVNMNLSDYIDTFNFYGVNIFEKDNIYTCVYVYNSVSKETASLVDYLTADNLNNKNVLLKEFMELEDIAISINDYELVAVLSSYKCKVDKCYTSNTEMDLVFPVFEINELTIVDGSVSIIENNEIKIHKELRRIQKGYPMPMIYGLDNSWYGGSLSSLGNIENKNDIEYLVTAYSDEFLSGFDYKVNGDSKILEIKDLFN
ncbi:MAG: hypothetical protein ACI35S_02230 [Anaeroplasma sp.]